MPTSWNEVIPHILKEVLNDSPESILDIGIGFGKYGVLLREVFDIPYKRYDKDTWSVKIDGIEGFANYKNAIHDYAYNQVYYENVWNVIDDLPSYDTILLIDVIEHFDKEEGHLLINELLKHTNKSLIISTPIHPEPQGEYNGNFLETHKSRWSIIDFIKYDYMFQTFHIGNNGAHIIKIYPSVKQEVIPLQPIERKLTIGYYIPHHNITGGLKSLLNQMSELHNRGHKIIAYFKSNQSTKALPPWFEKTAMKEVVIPTTSLITDYITECDIVIAGWISQLIEFQNTNVPVIYYEQGHEQLFGQSYPVHYVQEQRQFFKLSYNLFPVISISKTISTILEARYNIKSKILPAFIDTSLYSPSTSTSNSELPVILLVGNPSLRFKGFDTALQSLTHLWYRGNRFEVKWLCQSQPWNLSSYPFPIETFIQLPEKELIKWYQKATLLLFTSLYEGYGLPPLEAMACGLPVVSTKCGGIDDYAIDGYNILLAEPDDSKVLADKLEYLLHSEKTRETIKKRGLATAEQFNHYHVTNLLESYLVDFISENEQKINTIKSATDVVTNQNE